jgi:hypothetical protein
MKELMNMNVDSKRAITLYLGLGTVVAGRLVQLRNNVTVPRWVYRHTSSPAIHRAYMGVGWSAVIAGWPALLAMRTIVVKNREQHGVYHGSSSRWLTLGPRPVREFEDVAE